MSRLTIDLTEQQHRQLETVANMENKPAGNYAAESLDEPESMEISAELRDFLNGRIQEALDGRFSAKTIWQIAEEAWMAAAK